MSTVKCIAVLWNYSIDNVTVGIRIEDLNISVTSTRKKKNIIEIFIYLCKFIFILFLQLALNCFLSEDNLFT